MSNRFDLETEILNFGNVADDLDNVCEAILERDMDADSIVNALLGLSTLIRLRVDKTFETFKSTFKLDEYSPNYSPEGAINARAKKDKQKTKGH